MTTRLPGRLAFRVEGPFWVAYYALPDTMEDAVVLGTIRVAHVNNPQRRAVFMELMKDAVSDMLEDIIGARPEWPFPPEVAPDHERTRE